MPRRTWVTADTHFGEQGAIDRFGRPFADVREMDEALLDAINRCVGKRDELLHLGDVFGDLDWKDRGRRREARALLARIRCRRIRLVLGNKDPQSRSFRALFRSADESLTLRVDAPSGKPRRAVCHHYPMRQWRGMRDGSLHLHGHAHGGLEELGRSVDVGVDCWGFEPVLLDELVAMLSVRPLPAGEFVRRQQRRGASDEAARAQPPL
jgi:calcineurin-like phosphoesterase family protein